MLLLLGGTLMGLWSYRTTMRAFDSKLVELVSANALQIQIKLLAKSSSQENAGTADREWIANLGKVREALKKYEIALDDTVQRGRALDEGYNEKVQVQALWEHLERLQNEIDRQLEHNGPMVMIHQRPLLARVPSIKKELDGLVRTADDLNDAIYTGANDRIRLSKKHYEFSFGIALAITIGGVLLLIGLLRRFYCWVFHPIRDLERGAERVAQGNFDESIDIQSGDEMQELAAAFNHMMDRLRDIYSDLAKQVNERSRQLVRSERLASVGFLAAGVAHEINNPLASIAFCSEALEERLKEILGTGSQQRDTIALRQPISEQDRETMTRYLNMIQNEAFRCKEITKKLLEFSRGGDQQREPVDLNDITQSVLDVVQHLQNCKGKHIRFQPDAQLIAWVNAPEIKSVVLNIVVNAMESMEEGGTLTISQRNIGGTIEMVFQDTGCGMNTETLENIFEPFYTQSRTGKGTGLGLSICHRIINQHGGDIEAMSQGANRGSTFVVRLPVRVVGEAGPNEESEESSEMEDDLTYRERFAA